MKNFIRVVILNYNGAKLTIDLVSMIQNQSYDDFEIVVVDNASEIEDYLYLTNNLPPIVHLIKSEINLGYSAGNNLGLRYNSGKEVDYFLILNNDLIIEDIFLLKKLVESFNLNLEKLVYATSPLVNTIHSSYPSHSQIQVRKLLKPILLYLLSFVLFKKVLNPIFKRFIYFYDMPFSNKYLICDTINGAAFMISKKVIESFHYFDENVFLYHEEMILGKQIKDIGGVCILNGFVEVKHMQGISTKSTPFVFSTKMERYKYSSEAYFFQRYLGINQLFVKVFCLLKELELKLKRFLFTFR